MGRNRFASHGTKRIELADGDWIEVKTGLTAGEQRVQDQLALVPVVVDGLVHERIDWSKYEFLRTDLWITSWSLTRQTADGKEVPVLKSVATLQAMESEDFDEINEAVYAHIKEWIAAKKVLRAAQKETASAQPAPSDSLT